ncbi:MAG: hypothetical protein VX740_11070 [Pseudomonadota bacterium]|nr:hypothetical protein [Alphaproteobacteria bacterium]MEC7701981.1 hypothetical protein [Pseudomonadota bacterium]MEC9235847.1 hypothetical protein [Pseudomonadota bacterium]MED5423969.1 hypothetical protein [Pseudomonadota bacterium]
MRFLCFIVMIYFVVSGQAFIRLAMAEDTVMPLKPMHMAEFDKDRFKQELMKLSPEERAARIEEARQKHQEKIHNCREDIEHKWQNADARGRVIFCQKMQQKCKQRQKPFACDVYADKCSDQSGGGL